MEGTYFKDKIMDEQTQRNWLHKRQSLRQHSDHSEF